MTRKKNSTPSAEKNSGKLGKMQFAEFDKLMRNFLKPGMTTREPRLETKSQLTSHSKPLAKN